MGARRPLPAGEVLLPMSRYVRSPICTSCGARCRPHQLRTDAATPPLRVREGGKWRTAPGLVLVRSDESVCPRCWDRRVRAVGRDFTVPVILTVPDTRGAPC